RSPTGAHLFAAFHHISKRIRKAVAGGHQFGQRAGILPIDRTQKRLRRAHYGIAHAAILTTVGASPSWSAYLRHSDRYFMVPRNPTYPSGRTITTFFLVPSRPMPSSSN